MRGASGMLQFGVADWRNEKRKKKKIRKSIDEMRTNGNCFSHLCRPKSSGQYSNSQINAVQRCTGCSYVILKLIHDRVR